MTPQEYTQKAIESNPELAKRFQSIYLAAEAAKDEFFASRPMFKWPVGTSGKYADLDTAEDSLDARRVASIWKETMEVIETWRRLFPAPSHCWWGADREGLPNLVQDDRFSGQDLIWLSPFPSQQPDWIEVDRPWWSRVKAFLARRRQ